MIEGARCPDCGAMAVRPSRLGDVPVPLQAEDRELTKCWQRGRHGDAVKVMLHEVAPAALEDLPDALHLAERCRDGWAIVRTVAPYDADKALHRGNREYDADTRVGTLDGLADDLLEAARFLSGGG